MLLSFKQVLLCFIRIRVINARVSFILIHFRICIRSYCGYLISALHAMVAFPILQVGNYHFGSTKRIIMQQTMAENSSLKNCPSIFCEVATKLRVYFAYYEKISSCRIKVKIKSPCKTNRQFSEKKMFLSWHQAIL